MVKVDIHNREKNLERNTDKYISRLFQEDQEDVRRFINDHLANGYSFGRIDKYLTSLIGIRRTLDKPFRTATQDDVCIITPSQEGGRVLLYTRNPGYSKRGMA